MTGLLFWLCVSAVGYAYVGYPALLALLTRGRPRPAWPTSDAPTVTLLIAAYNEEEVIGAKLEDSLALAYPRERLQILVAADGSDDRTAEIVRGYAARGVELSHRPERRGKMAAINRAIGLARGSIVVFSDANNHYRRDAITELVAPFADPAVGASTGAKRIATGDGALGDSEDLYWRYESFIKERETRLGSSTGVAGEIFAIRRALFEPPPDEVINDDFYLALSVIRRGFRVVYVPTAQSVERVSPTAEDEVVRRSRIVAGRYQAIAMAPRTLPLRRPLIVWQVVSHKFLRPLVPFAMLGAAIFSMAAVAFPGSGGRLGILRLVAPWNWLALLFQGAFYVTAVVAPRRATRGGLGRLLYLPTFLVDSNRAAVFGLGQFLRRRRGGWQRVARRSDAVGSDGGSPEDGRGLDERAPDRG